MTDADIHAAIRDGATTAEAVMLATRAGSRCGSCRSEVAAMVDTAVTGDSMVATSRPCCRDGKRHLPLQGELDDRAA